MGQDEKLYELISSKTFEALTSEEKTFVLKHLTEEEYVLQRTIIQESERLFEEEAPLLQPELETKQAPLAIMANDEDDEQLPWFLLIFTKRIPAYAMVIPVLLMGAFWLFGSVEREEPKTKVLTKTVEVPRLITEVDTVFVEKEVPVEVVKEFVRLVEVEVPVPQKSASDLAFLPVSLQDKSGDADVPLTIDSASKILRNQLKNISQSAADRPELKQFQVSVP